VLVQTNFGGVLSIAGAPVGRELGQYYLKGDLGNGSVMIVVATDAPLDHRQLERLGRRALAGLARTGSSMGNGSGDFVIAFANGRSGGPAVGRSRAAVSAGAPDRPTARLTDTVAVVTNDAMSPLFEAAIEATEEAIYNSLFKAETVRGLRGTIRALPVDSTVAILKRHALLPE
jgi:D-aminopeptidase